MRAMHDVEVAIDDVRFVVEGVVIVESEELIPDGCLGIGLGGDIREQVESAAEFLVKDGAGQVVAARRAAIQEEPAAEPLIRLVDRDILAGHIGVADEKRGRGQTAKSAANDMGLHLFLPWSRCLGGPPHPSPL